MGRPAHTRVRFKEVYPGIDLDYYGSQGRLEFDFIVDAGADPSRIRLGFEGVQGVRLEPSSAPTGPLSPTPAIWGETTPSGTCRSIWTPAAAPIWSA